MASVDQNLNTFFKIIVNFGNQIKSILIIGIIVTATVTIAYIGCKWIFSGENGAMEALSHLKLVFFGILLASLACMIVTASVNLSTGYSPSASNTNIGATNGYSTSDFEGGLSFEHEYDNNNSLADTVIGIVTSIYDDLHAGEADEGADDDTPLLMN